MADCDNSSEATLWSPAIDRLIDLALSEDVSGGDATSESVFSHPEVPVTGRILAGARIVCCGLPVGGRVVRRSGWPLSWKPCPLEGQQVEPGTLLAEVSGPVVPVMGIERVLLNFLMRMSGVATQVRRYVDAVAGTGAQIVDTRKTLPGWRGLDKYAVRVGGGRNHRFDLASGILIKDNHIAACGSLTDAVLRARERAPHPLRIAVEVETEAQIDEALAAGAEVLLLDNMSVDRVAQAVRQIGGRALIEVSGGITLADVGAYAAAGVKYISVGVLTHSVPAGDVSLQVQSDVVVSVPLDDALQPGRVKPRLNTRWLGHSYHHLREVASTNDEVARLSAGGAEHGTVIVADRQTAGRGRLRRRWYSPPAENLCLSILMRPEISPAAAPPMGLAAAVGVAEALAQLTGERPTVKWPNDLLYAGKKVAGILLELSAEAQRIRHLALGIGVNVNTRVFPAPLTASATSLALRSGADVSRLDVLVAVLERLEPWIDRLVAGELSQVVDAWLSYADWIGQRLTVHTGSGSLAGIAVGLDESGALLLRGDDGRERAVTVGDVELLPQV